MQTVTYRNVLALLIIINGSFSSVLLSSAGSNLNSPSSRKLVVYPGFNEIEATNKYKEQLKTMLKRVKDLHHNLDLLKEDTEREVDNVVQKINSETDKDAYDSLLNDMFFQKLQDVKNSGV